VVVCESCGAKFDLASLPAEVSSTRLLCAACYWKRQAEKAAKKGGGAPAATPSPVAPTVIAKPPPAPAAKPAPAPAAKPAPAPEPAAKPEPAAAKPEPAAAKPEPAAEKPASASKAAAAHHHAAPAKRGGRGHGGRSPVEDERAKLLNPDDAPLLDATTKKLAMVAVIFVLVFGVVFWKVKGQQHDEKAQAEDIQRKKDELIAALRTFDAATVDGANRIVGMVDSSRATWVGTEIAGEVNTLKSKAANFIQAEQNKRDYFDRLAAVEAAAMDIGSKPSQEGRDLKRRADGLVLQALEFGADAQMRALSIKNKLEMAVGTRVKEEAIAAIDSLGATDPRGALVKLASAEDEVRVLWEKAYKEKNTEFKTLLEAYLQELIAKSDTLATSFFTDAEKEKTPWRDLLLGDAATEWKAGATKGLEWKVEAGVLRAKGPDEDARGRAVLSIGDKQRWRDFVIEGEFTIEKGVFTLCFRLGATPNQNTDTTEVRAEEGDTIAPGGTYAFTYEVVGSNTKLKWKDDVKPVDERSLFWNFNRAGAFGIVVEKGTVLRFTRLRIRELR
jgi:nitrogen fixation-related uncharacterized protein